MCRLPALALLLLACGRTSFNGSPSGATPAPAIPCAMTGPLGETKYPVVSSLAVVGDDLYVTSHEAYLPMRYRTPGAVERLSRCGGPASAIGPSDEDLPEGLQAGDDWVHWRAHDFNAVGETKGELVRSLPRGKGELVSRQLERRPARLSGPFVAGGALFWLASHRLGSDLQSSAEGGTAVRQVGRFDVSTLFSGGDVLLRVEPRQAPLANVSALDALGQEVHLWSVRYDAVVFGIEGGALWYQEYDEAAKRFVVRRRALKGDADAELLYLPEGRAELGLATVNALYVAERERLVRVDLSDRRVTTLRALAAPDEQVLALAHDGERLYVALGNRYGSERARLVAVVP